MNRVTLIRPRWIAPVSGTAPVLVDHAVAISSDRITAIGPFDELAARHPDAPVTDLPDHLLIPGLVNAHGHAAMTLLRGAGDDLPLAAWLNERIWPLERALVSDEFVYDGTVLACQEMLLSGITCFGDMYFFPEATARAALDMRMRAAVGIVVFDFPSAYASGPADYLSKGLALRDRLADQPLLSFSLSPHAPYTVSDATFRRIAAIGAELELPICTHLHETPEEVERSIAEHGLRPIERLEKLGLLGPDFVAIHAVAMSESDIALLARTGGSMVHCPHSNLKLAAGIAPLVAMHQAGVHIALGTDGAASNNRLDLLEEGRLASLLAKVQSDDAAAFGAHDVLAALTRGGAIALGLADRIGTIEPGKQADLVAVDLSPPHYGPVLDPVATLIHTSGRQAVTDVWIAGERVVSERQITASLSRQAVGTVLARSPLWHNRLGEFVSGREG